MPGRIFATVKVMTPLYLLFTYYGISHGILVAGITQTSSRRKLKHHDHLMGDILNFLLRKIF